MDCKTCHVPLVSIMNFTGHRPHTYDFDKDGFAFKICPNCLEAVTFGTREAQAMQRAELLALNTYSVRDKRHVVFQLANHAHLDYEPRKILIAGTMNKCKNKQDKDVGKVISESFQVPLSKVQMLLYRVKLMRNYED